MAEARATASRSDGTVTRRTALLAGATGLVRGHCLELLLHDDAWAKDRARSACDSDARSAP
jgi:hypothetical protein